ncbi:heme utilization cystosolic carrier protein HutX [Microbulbifer discodermiae]|uniref:heme utilization cystosolic carrier protein HutX n=1 Tax=Microbulbifer sp. 2201CG32-9 TaxID=3232309 RepID=UPI00345B6B9B
MTPTGSNLAPGLPGSEAEGLMRELSSWANTATIILHAGCVFEFKGVFPPGEVAQGYYNLTSDGSGFEGHIKLAAIHRITFQTKPHRGRESCAFVFEDRDNSAIFKVFLGRDKNGDLLTEQVKFFKALYEKVSGDNHEKQET